MPLLRLFEAHLKPEGEVILTAEMRGTSMKFFKGMHSFFEMTAQKKVLRSKDKEIPVVLARMTPKRSSGPALLPDLSSFNRRFPV
jgi:hypothetical protein